jgi:hypothetical protein
MTVTRQSRLETADKAMFDKLFSFCLKSAHSETLFPVKSAVFFLEMPILRRPGSIYVVWKALAHDDKTYLVSSELYFSSLKC